MATLMERIALEADYCCVYEMLRSNRTIPRLKMCGELQVSRDTYDRWEAKVKSGELKPCSQCPAPDAPRKKIR